MVVLPSLPLLEGRKFLGDGAEKTDNDTYRRRLHVVTKHIDVPLVLPRVSSDTRVEIAANSQRSGSENQIASLPTQQAIWRQP